MRDIFVVVFGFVVIAAIVGAGAVSFFNRAPPPPAAATASLTLPAAPAAPTAPAAATSAPAEPTPAPATPAPATPAPVVTAPETPPTLPELPTEEVHEQPANPVPPGVSPMQPVTIEDRNGHTVTRPGSPGRPATATPEPAPAAVPEPSPAAVPAPTQTALAPPMAATVIGPASATGAVSLAVHGQGVRLYGVQPPGDADRCVSPRGYTMSCADVTREVLAERLARSTAVTCRLPPHRRIDEAPRICLDGGGVDIAGYLVAEGLALADPRESRDYLGAQGIAKSYRKGLWAYR
ncbi:MAG TPA: hypothetical protein VLX09_01480 [Stellaceae bacterium]|nr:hypothetical protein [Stellaceae bacterium]